MSLGTMSCGVNSTKIDTSAEAGSSSIAAPSSSAGPAAERITFEGYTYEVAPADIVRQVDNIAPGYAAPHPTFRVSLVSPTDRGAKLFTDFNAHFRLAYRRAVLNGALDVYGASYDLSTCQDVPQLPDFCVFNLLVEPGSRSARPAPYDSTLTDASGGYLQNAYAWISVDSPVYIRTTGDVIMRDAYQPSDFALLYLNYRPNEVPTVDDMVIVRD
ncbi:hypothetical protein ACIRSS_10165 [Amycolatopsis sp. NPDC101161]|uniref:hypothetical protein n=1 Tax=Amycolatopsis sp. NPDC101161 TaxID=3363940 RepID=UPI0037FCDF7B